MTFNWTIVILIIICLVAADKILTVANINAVKKNFPDKIYYYSRRRTESRK